MTISEEATALGNAIDERFDSVETKISTVRLRLAKLEAVHTPVPAPAPTPAPIPIDDIIVDNIILPEDWPTQPPQNHSGPLTFRNQQNLVIENLYITGQLKVVNCPGVIVRNVTCGRSSDDLLWGHLDMKNCPDARISYYKSIDNPRGHGIHLFANYHGTEMDYIYCTGAQEDGIQTAKQDTPFNWFSINHGYFTANKENGVDLKSGSGTIYNTYIQTNASITHEPIILQHFHGTTKFENDLIVDTPNPTKPKALASIYAGHAEFVDCRFGVIPGRVDKWFRDNADLPVGMAAVLLGVNQPDLLITGATHIAHDTIA